MSKDNRVFFKKVRVIFIYCLKTSSIGVHKNIIYQHICTCMANYILNVWSNFNLNAFPVIFFDFSLPVKGAPHESLIRTGQP